MQGAAAEASSEGGDLFFILSGKYVRIVEIGRDP